MFEGMEILSPAGDEKSFFAAINNGANAIYLGLQNFNARNKAENFDLENLSYFVNIAHLYNVKIYLVINTLITNEEMPKLIKLVNGAIKSKVDAFIVQDLGVVTTLKNTFKGINLHASTQMGVHSLQGALVAEKLGFSRVVLSREVTRQDILEIKNNTNLEIEYFVHGALCVSFSGNCYLSSLNSNESGNRGRCLQPCRLMYSSNSNGENLKKGYLLSANDLCLIDKIKELKECGITSFKIEGRLRRPSYVAYITKMYSLACNLAEKENLLQSKLRIENFKKLFNRGEYNTGFYLNGEPNKNIINPNFQNHRGIEIGKVKSVKPFKDIYEILVTTNGYEIKKGDGLKCILGLSEQSLGVGSVKQKGNKNEYIIYTKVKPKISCAVYLTVDNNWEESLLGGVKKIKFSAYFLGKENERAKLVLKVGNTSVKITSKQILEKAKNQVLKEIEIKENLQKTKDTFFELENLTCDIENVFMSKSALNELRREALENLQNKIIKDYEEKNIKPIEIDFTFYNSVFNEQNCNLVEKSNGFGEVKSDEFKSNNATSNKRKNNEIKYSDAAIHSIKIRNKNKEILPGEMETKNVNFICFNEFTDFKKIEKLFTENTKLVYSPSNYSLQNIENIFSRIKRVFNINKLYLNLPKILRSDDYKIIESIVTGFDAKSLGLVANNINGLYFSNLGFEIVGGVYLNITNSASVIALNNFDISHFVKSFESFSTMQEGLSFVGKAEVMTFCHCPYKTNFDNEHCETCKFNDNLILTGENGKTYKVRRTRIKSCIFELVDSNKLNLDKLKNDNNFIDLRE